MFKTAIKHNEPLHLALIGPAGSGKSYSGLKIATHLARGGRIAAIDTERGSLKKYADRFAFDVIEPATFGASVFTDGINAAIQGQYSVILIDSLSHAWAGPGGILEFKDQVAARGRGNDYAAWREATPEHNRLVNALMSNAIHVIVTMRSKMEYVQERDPQTGKTIIRKIGLQPVQRDGVEYEFDVVADMDSGTLRVTKTRCDEVNGKQWHHPGAEFADILLRWCGWSNGDTTTPIEQPIPPAPAPICDHPDDINARFAAACEAAGVAARDHAQELVARSGHTSWTAVPAAFIESAITALTPAPAAPVAPVTTVTAQHPAWARLMAAASAVGAVPSAACAALMESHGTLDAAQVPAEAVEAYAAQLEAQAATPQQVAI